MTYKNEFNESSLYLINRLNKEPEIFFNQGLSYDLLQEYFNGLPIYTLEDLLAADNVIIQRVAVWLIAELGTKAIEASGSLVELLDVDDRYIQYNSLQAIMIFSDAGKKQIFQHIVLSLEKTDYILRNLAMRYISTSTESQLKDAYQYFLEKEHTYHRIGLKILIDDNSVEILSFPNSDDENADELETMYSAILLVRKKCLDRIKSIISQKEISGQATRLFLSENAGSI